MEPSLIERLDFGKMGYGCKHYKRRCRIRAPCCNEVYSCRHCHNDATSMLKNPFDRHELVRQDVEQVVCSVCDTEQPVAQVCTNCGVRMGEYFCDICKFFDDDTGKQQFHCDDCGICRVGGRENYFHCKKCGSCYSVGLRGNHSCVENSMRHHCPICYEYLFDSLKDTTVMKCGHTMHVECYQEMIKRDKYCCPICSKSVVDMSRVWTRIDEEKCSFIKREPDLSFANQSSTCLGCGRELTKRLPQLSCLRTIGIERFGYFVMTAMTQLKFTSILLGKNAVTAVHITLALLLLRFFLNDQILVVQEMGLSCPVTQQL